MQTKQIVFLLISLTLAFDASIQPFSTNYPITTHRLLAQNDDREQMLHIQKLIDLTRQYKLTPSTAWQPYADLKDTIDLHFSQYVAINFKLALYVNQPCRMKVRVMIDGVQNKQFRREMNQTKFIVMLANDFVWLGKGKHLIQVQYIKSGVDETIQSNHINIALIKLGYLNRKQPIRQPQTLFLQSPLPIVLNTRNVWSTFPALQTNIKLQTKQEVWIHYKIAIQFDKIGSIATRVIIDGKQNVLFTIHSPHVYATSNFGSYPVKLQSGNHQIRVEYRTSSNVVNTQSDWNRCFLLIKY